MIRVVERKQERLIKRKNQRLLLRATSGCSADSLSSSDCWPFLLLFLPERAVGRVAELVSKGT